MKAQAKGLDELYRNLLLSANFKSGLLTKGQRCQNANIALKGQVDL